MKILAISVKDHEYAYKPETAHKVPVRSAQIICDVCNAYNFKIKPGECWFIHDVDQYDIAYDYATFQSFTIRKGIVTAHYN